MDSDRRNKWVDEIKKYQQGIEDIHTFLLCQLHFEEEYIIYGNNGRVSLRADAIPTIFHSVKTEPNADQSNESDANLAAQVSPFLDSPETATPPTVSKLNSRTQP